MINENEFINAIFFDLKMFLWVHSNSWHSTSLTSVLESDDEWCFITRWVIYINVHRLWVTWYASYMWCSNIRTWYVLTLDLFRKLKEHSSFWIFSSHPSPCPVFLPWLAVSLARSTHSVVFKLILLMSIIVF